MELSQLALQLEYLSEQSAVAENERPKTSDAVRLVRMSFDRLPVIAQSFSKIWVDNALLSSFSAACSWMLTNAEERPMLVQRRFLQT